MSYVVCRMSVVCQINCVGVLRTVHAHVQSLFVAVKPVTPVLFISFYMDKKEAEARPVMETIFLVTPLK